MEEGDDFYGDSMICESGSHFVTSGFMFKFCRFHHKLAYHSWSQEVYAFLLCVFLEPEEVVMFVNAGRETSRSEYSGVQFLADDYYEGGIVLRADECINEAGDYPSLYESARLGICNYRFSSVPPGHYVVDLHFAEIVNTFGPKGLRVFNVFIQDEMVLSEFDIFAVVGANKPLQLVDCHVLVKDDGMIVIKFEGVVGSPVVSGICIWRASKFSEPPQAHKYLGCLNCAAEILVTQKTEQTVEMQAEKLKTISTTYEHEKKFWSTAITDLKENIKRLKQEHSELSCEAHECADSILDLNKMVFAVQDLVAQCEDLKLKYFEEQNKRKKLYNEVQEAKGNIRVFCRCRPLSKPELSTRCTTVVSFDGAKDGDIVILAGGSNRKTFKLDRVYTPDDDQGLNILTMFYKNLFLDAPFGLELNKLSNGAVEEQEKLLPWRVQNRIGGSIIELSSNYLKLQREEVILLHTIYLSVCLKSIMSRSGTWWQQHLKSWW